MSGTSTRFLVVLLLSLITGLPTFARAELIDVVSVTASDYDATRDRFPENAIDGDLGTKWTTLSMPQWITLDLGATYNINQTRILSYTPHAGLESVYSISVSLDNINWTNVIENKPPNLAPEWTESAIDLVTARYIRFSLNSSNASDYANVYEIEVYGQPNSIPVASHDATSTELNTATNIAVLSNDSKLDDLPINVLIYTPPENGQVIVEADNTITYLPNSGFIGMDSLQYEVVDHNGDKAIASVSIDVQCSACLTDVLPTLINVISVTASDYDAARDRFPANAVDGDLRLKWTTLSMPQWITLDLGATYDISQTRMLSYTPHGGAGSVYTISVSLDNLNWIDVIGNETPNLSPAWTEAVFDVVTARYVRFSLNSSNTSDYANVYEIEVYGQPDNTAIARHDISKTELNTAVNIDVLSNDSNLDNLPIIVSINTPPENGQVVVEADNTITYLPNSGFTGTDSLLYEVVDNNGDKAIASVTVNVLCSTCLADELVTLTWNPNTDVILGYAVYYGPTQDSANLLTSELPLTSDLLNPDAPSIQYHLGNDLGLLQGDGICFRLKAYNESGFSDFSGAACL